MRAALLRRFLKESSGTLLPRVALAATIVTLFSVGAAYMLATRPDTEQRALSQLIERISRDPASFLQSGEAVRRNADPVVTGSVSRSAASVKLDPCTSPRGR